MNHLGYRCLDVVTGRVFLSRHVVFNETNFPFQQTPLISSNTAAPVRSDLLLLLKHKPVVSDNVSTGPLPSEQNGITTTTSPHHTIHDTSFQPIITPTYKHNDNLDPPTTYHQPCQDETYKFADCTTGYYRSEFD